MNWAIAFYILSLLVLFAGSAFFSGSETALFSLSATTLRRWQDSGTPGQRLTARLMQRHHATLIAILLGNNIVNVLAAVLFNRLIGMHVHGAAAPVVAGLAVTVLLLILGEVTPKTIAFSRAETMAVRIAPVIRTVTALCLPLVRLLESLSGMILRVTAKPGHLNAISVDEFQTYVSLGRRMGAFGGAEAALFRQVFRLRETTTSAAMVPRVDVVTVDVGWDDEMLVRHTREACHRRLPAVDGDLDRLVGILDVKRFLRASAADRRRWAESCLDAPVYVPEATSLNKALRLLRTTRRGMCLVVDEYGGVSGLLTMEDITEEIMGDVSDEYDVPTWEINELAPGHWRLSGLVQLHELRDRVPVDLPRTTAETLGGLISERLGELPEIGQRVDLGTCRCEVRRVSRHRVLEVDLLAAEGEARA